MKFVYSIFLIFLLACQQERSYPEYKPEPEVNPWEYINRISDTLPQIKFSLCNSYEDNLNLLQKLNKNSLFIKYRVGQNRFIPVNVIHIQNYQSLIILKRNTLNFNIDFDGDFFSLGMEIHNINIPGIEDTICSSFFSLLEHKDEKDIKCSFTIQFSGSINQSTQLLSFDKIALGYFKFLNKISRSQFNKGFTELNQIKQNEIISNYTLALQYDFHEWHLRESMKNASDSSF